MNEAMKEIWKDVPGYEDLYQASNLGRIKSLARQKGFVYQGDKILIPQKTPKGYYRIGLIENKKTKMYFIHRLMLFTFKEFSDLEVNHINGIKTDNRLENLEYCTRSENMKHAWKNGLCENHRQSVKNIFKKHNDLRKTPIVQFEKTGKFIAEYESQKEAERKTGIFQSNITNCCREKIKSAGGYIWKYKNILPFYKK